MTQQFKFGDLVRRSRDIRRFVYLHQADAHPEEGWIRSESGGDYLVTHSELTPVPHPDTVRLDWLADRDQHIGNVQLPAECVTCNLHSLRDAIDMAMQMQPENGAGTQEKDA